MDVKIFRTKAFDENCYLLYGKSEAIIVDPADPSGGLLDFVGKRRIVAIVNTHGHVDHIAGNSWFKQRTQASVMIHEADEEYLNNPILNLSSLVGQQIVGPPADRLLQNGSELTIDGEKIQVIHTPGHTPGSICLSAEGILLSGDTLFFQSIGRTDFPGGNARQLQLSLKSLRRLAKETVVYPGHGRSTTIGEEILQNPYLR